MNIKKDVKYTIELNREDYNALAYMAGIMIKIIDNVDDSILLENLKIDLNELEAHQDLLWAVAENIQFSH